MSPSPLMNVAVARAAERLPVLKRLPLARLGIVAEVAILAKEHLDLLTPKERRRLLILLRDARLWPANLSDKDRREFERIVAKLDPKAFAARAVAKFSPLGGTRR